MTVYDGIGISLYMMVHDRHMSVYDKYSVLILVMATDVPGIRSLISSGFLPTYDVVGIRTTSYLPDIGYDIVGQDLRRRMCTTSYVMAYDIDIRHRMCPTYDVETYDMHTIS